MLTCNLSDRENEDTRVTQNIRTKVENIFTNTHFDFSVKVVEPQLSGHTGIFFSFSLSSSHNATCPNRKKELLIDFESKQYMLCFQIKKIKRKSELSKLKFNKELK